ncbi:3-dehydroquinate synthase [Virgibacillus flavescens]|uniref:3-dehydroquinate synthase n=1 Tax=Virgibacillus flavescens TaxID=1611422 RepID=UPI003D335527
MNIVEVKTSTNSYSIYMGGNIRHQSNLYNMEKYSSIFIITDRQVAELYLEDIKKSLTAHPRVFQAIITEGEKSKGIDEFYQLQTEAIKYGLDRNSLIIALGGGVVGDLAGFVASTFMRGIEYIQVPTTILAHDSSVGGKVAINHLLGKNLIGSFYPPSSVIYDSNTLRTLPAKEVRSGYAEIIKEALIADKGLFENILKTDISNVSSEVLEQHIFEGIKIKKHYIQSDEREKGDRAFLNFGHTLGHALESEYGYGTVTHGEAVAIGMVFALEVSSILFSANLPIENLLSWLKRNHYPCKLNDVSVDNLFQRMKTDKKVRDNQIQMVLLKDIGNPVTVKINDADLRSYLEKFIIKFQSKTNEKQ